MEAQLDATTSKTYAFEKALQGPVLEMRLRGVAVDQTRREEVIEEFIEKMEVLEARLEKIVYEGLGIEFNWRSHHDLRDLFYSELGLPEIKKRGASNATTDRAAREKLQAYPVATQLIKHINALTEIGDKISVLRTGIDNDGRIRTSYNIAGTSTGRFSSSLSEFGTGGNLQNVEESLRSIFIADPGYKFAKADAKSGESYCVGAIEWNLFGDGKYLDACESGDPHTAVARICWPGLQWTGDLRRDREIADQPYYRHYSYRFACKKLGHGSNYEGEPSGLAAQSRVPLSRVTDFQRRYFAAFPAHRDWQASVKDTIRAKGCLTTLTGRRRYFLGRRNDPDTYREAIAFDPQGSLADIVNTAMLNIWRKNYCTIMFQDHDAITFMYPEHLEDRTIKRLMSDIVVPLPLANGRELRIPYDFEVGWNKGKYDASKNPNGLREYRGHDNRKRQKEAGVLDRVVYRPNRKP